MARMRRRRNGKRSTVSKIYRGVRTGIGVARTAYTAYKGVKFLASIVNAEKQLFDTSGTQSDVQNTPGAFVGLNTIAQGTDKGERIGNSIKPSYITGTFQVNLGATGNLASTVRIMIIQDTSSLGSLPSASDIFEDPSDPILSGVKRSNTPRFWMLFDKRVRVDTGNSVVILKCFRRLNYHIKFTGAANNNYGKNNTFLVLISDAAVSDGPTISYYLRLAYYDN